MAGRLSRHPWRGHNRYAMRRLATACLSLLLMGATCAGDSMIDAMPSHEQCIEAWNNPRDPESRPAIEGPAARVEITPFAYGLGEVDVYKCVFDFYSVDGERIARTMADGVLRPDAERFRMRFEDDVLAEISYQEIDSGSAELIGATAAYRFSGTAIGEQIDEP